MGEMFWRKKKLSEQGENPGVSHMKWTGMLVLKRLKKWFW